MTDWKIEELPRAFDDPSGLHLHCECRGPAYFSVYVDERGLLVNDTGEEPPADLVYQLLDRHRAWKLGKVYPDAESRAIHKSLGRPCPWEEEPLSPVVSVPAAEPPTDDEDEHCEGCYYDDGLPHCACTDCHGGSNWTAPADDDEDDEPDPPTVDANATATRNELARGGHVLPTVEEWGEVLDRIAAEESESDKNRLRLKTLCGCAIRGLHGQRTIVQRRIRLGTGSEAIRELESNLLKEIDAWEAVDAELRGEPWAVDDTDRSLRGRDEQEAETETHEEQATEHGPCRCSKTGSCAVQNTCRGTEGPARTGDGSRRMGGRQ